MTFVTAKLVVFTLLHFGLTIGAVATLHRPPRARRPRDQVEAEELASPSDSEGWFSGPGSA